MKIGVVIHQLLISIILRFVLCMRHSATLEEALVQKRRQVPSMCTELSRRAVLKSGGPRCCLLQYPLPSLDCPDLHVLHITPAQSLNVQGCGWLDSLRKVSSPRDVKQLVFLLHLALKSIISFLHHSFWISHSLHSPC